MSDPDRPERVIVIYENERYNALTRGWSSSSLLPTDRDAFSSVHGKKSFKARVAAEAWALGDDWRWASPPWETGAWEYAGDFSATAAWTPVAGSFAFVRRRPHSRRAVYALDDAIAARTCAGCDVEASAAVVRRLKQALASAALVAHRDESGDDDVERARCRALIEDLRRALLSAAPSGAPAEALKAAVDGFLAAVDERSQTLSRMFLAKADVSADAVAARVAAFEQRDCFVGLDALARAVVRRFDDGNGACSGGHPADDCPFAPAPCPNDECGAIVSRRRLKAHDERCPYTREECMCGTLVQRRRRADHLAQDCAKRQVRCPFGCAQTYAADQLGGHLDTAAPAHALLLLERLKSSEAAQRETAEELKACRAQLSEERSKRVAADATLAALGVAVAATKRDVASSSAQGIGELRKEVELARQLARSSADAVSKLNKKSAEHDQRFVAIAKELPARPGRR